MEFENRKCGQCRFWFSGPADPLNFQPRLGECRGGVPQLVTLPQFVNRQTGQVTSQIISQYPQTRNNYPACGLFEEKIELAGEGDKSS